MNAPRYSGAAARLLRHYLPAATVTLGDESRGVITIERAIRARTRRRRLWTFGGSVAAAAAMLLAGTELTKWRQPRAGAATPIAINVTPSGQGAALAGKAGEERLDAPAAIESGQRIDTPADGGASLQLSTGTSMTLAGRTSFRVDSQGATQRFSLQRGELVAHVAKLGASQRFIVDTPDAQVEVRGTRFRLRVIEHAETCSTQTRTRLEVTEGVVEVRGAGRATVSVGAGETWPADCANAGQLPQSAEFPPPAARTGAAPSKREHAARSGTPSVPGQPESVSALTAQNDLFAEGVARGRQGDTGGALRAYQELMTRFPSSALAENALVERMRLLAATPDRAAEARRYLARYPRGFAANEAKKLLAQP